jgi:hypothetical protein
MTGMADRRGTMTMSNGDAVLRPAGPPRPGAVTALRLLLLVPGWMMTASFVAICATEKSVPFSSDPLDLMYCAGPVAVVLGHLGGPRRRTVHVLIVACQFALAVLYLTEARRASASLPGTLAVLAYPVAGLVLAFLPRVWAYSWNGAELPPSGRLHRHRAVVHTSASDGGVTIDVGRRLQSEIAAGGSAAGFLGVCAVVEAFLPGPAGHRIAVALVGAPFLLVGLSALLAQLDAGRRRRARLTIDAHGIHWTTPEAAVLDLPWADIQDIAISHAHAPHNLVTPTPGTTRVRLLIRPRTPPPHFIPLGDNPDFIPAMHTALHRFAPTTYRGIHDQLGVGFHLT